MALSPTKRVYAILCKMRLCFGKISIWKNIYLLLKSSEGTEKKLHTAFHAVLSSSIEVYTHFGLHVLDDEAEEPP